MASASGSEDFPNSYSGAVLFDDPLVYYRMNDTDAQGGYDSVETATNLGTLGSSYDGSYVHCCSHEQLGAPGALLPGDDDPSIRFEAKTWDDPPNVQIADSDKLLDLRCDVARLVSDEPSPPRPPSPVPPSARSQGEGGERQVEGDPWVGAPLSLGGRGGWAGRGVGGEGKRRGWNPSD